MIQVHANAGQAQVAGEWMEKLKSSGLKLTTHTYGIMIDMHAEQGDAAKCEQLLCEMKDHSLPVNLVLHNTIVKAHVNAGDFSRARHALGAISAHSLAPDNYSYNPLFYGLVRGGSLREAEDLIDEMTRASLEPHALLHQALAAAKERGQEAGPAAAPLPDVDWIEEKTPEGARHFRSARGDGALRQELPVSGLVQLQSEQGPYFWNVDTNVTSWELPSRRGADLGGRLPP